MKAFRSWAPQGGRIAMSQRQRIIPYRFFFVILTICLLFGSLLFASTRQQGRTVAHAAVTHAAANNLAQKPYMGWSTWSLESTAASGYGTKWLTEAHVKAQADCVHHEVQPNGNPDINIYAGW